MNSSRRWAATGIVLLIAVVAGIVVLRGGDDHPKAGLTYDFGGGEGHPGCVYRPEAHRVDATIRVEGKAPRKHAVTITVTAYADENTSIPVGSSSRTVQVDGSMHRSIHFSIPVDKAPQVGEDDVAACARSVR